MFFCLNKCVPGFVRHAFVAFVRFDQHFIRFHYISSILGPLRYPFPPYPYTLLRFEFPPPSAGLRLCRRPSRTTAPIGKTHAQKLSFAKPSQTESSTSPRKWESCAPDPLKYSELPWEPLCLEKTINTYRTSPFVVESQSFYVCLLLSPSSPHLVSTWG
jgi:hypothetical protein